MDVNLLGRLLPKSDQPINTMTHKFKTREELAQELNISYKTLYRLLKRSDIDIPKNKLLSPAHCYEIYQLVLPDK
ncbi:MAG: hypothetical protein Roseis2KO_33900 [Roseivirga sp.]